MWFLLDYVTSRLLPVIVVCEAASVNAQLRLHRGYTLDAGDGGFRCPSETDLAEDLKIIVGLVKCGNGT
jgi:hypothetical protein